MSMCRHRFQAMALSLALSALAEVAEARTVFDERFDDLQPDEPLPGWTRGAYSQRDVLAPNGGAGAAMVNTNRLATMARFELVKGDVTVEAWMRPKAGQSANNALRIGNHLDGFTNGEWARNATFVLKNDQDLWWYADAGQPSVAFRVFDGDWHRIRIVVHTPVNAYDLYFDNEPIRLGIPSPLALNDGISVVGFSSGRWGGWPDAWSYFDDALVYVGEPTRKPKIVVLPAFADAIAADAATRLTVRVLSDAGFDATTIVADSVRFGPKGARPMANSVAVGDFDADGLADWSAVFRLGSSGIGAGSSDAAIRGDTKDGNDFASRYGVYVSPADSGAPLDPRGKLAACWASFKRR